MVDDQNKATAMWCSWLRVSEVGVVDVEVEDVDGDALRFGGERGGQS